MAPDTATERVAVVDLGSNTARLVVYERTGDSLQVVANDRENLRLLLGVGDDGALSPDAEQRLASTLERFIGIAASTGASRIAAVATDALRRCTNGADVLDRLNAVHGIDIGFLDERSEGTLSTAGALTGLPSVDNGIAVDIGGGSLEITRFRDRQPEESWCFPLGALRVSSAFLTSDPPSDKELDRLKKHVRSVLAGANLPLLEEGEVLIGVGGSIRNIDSIIHRSRKWQQFRPGDHIERKGVRRVMDALSLLTIRQRAELKGLTRDRADSILGGAIVLRETMKALKAKEIIVSGTGLREGVLLEFGTSVPARTVGSPPAEFRINTVG